VIISRFVLIAALGSVAVGRTPELLPLDGDIERVHDPAIIRQNDTYYVFCTGRHPGGGIIPIRTSKDLRHWTLSGAVFDKLPDWVTREIPGARDAWAPDISYFSGRYHLYYAVSTFGKNNSAIGLATNTTLDPASPNYKWVDEGMVIRSRQGQDDWNAIDPNLVIENKNKVWLNWGSFWGGIKMRRIDPASGKLSSSDTRLYSLASRPAPTHRAIEAPFIVRDGRYWYLFVSFDFCCRGAKSDYKVVAGRAKKVTGPYLDAAGHPLTEGAGSPVESAATAKWHGAGHEAVLHDGRNDYLVFHAYDAITGRPVLQISTIVWEDGWPKAAPMP
jgi:arabinan endo-1,5-alpha-L-arabinosidase